MIFKLNKDTFDQNCIWMGDFSFKIFGKTVVEKRSLENPSVSLSDPDAINELWDLKSDEIHVNQQTALTYSAVWRAINLVSGTIAMVPLRIIRRKADGNKEIAYDHPIYDLLHNEPNAIETSFGFRERIMQYLLSWGDGMAFIHRDNYFKPYDLEVVHPNSVEVFEHRRELYYKTPLFKKPVPSYDMIHIKGFGDGIRGKDPITVARESLAGGLIYQKTGNNFFKNGHLNDRFITTAQGIPQEDKRELFRKTLKNAVAGMKNAGEIPVLYGGMEMKSIGMPPENMQFLESKKHHLSEVARWFGVPPHKIYDLDRSTNNNIEHQGIEFVTDTILHYTVRIEQELNRKLFTKDERKTYYSNFNLNGLLRGDLKTRAEYYNKATGGRPWLAPDDVRKLEDMNTIGGEASELITPLNFKAPDKNSNNE